MGRLQGIIERYHLDKWFEKENLIVLVLAGLLLVVIGIPIEDTGKGQEQKEGPKTVSEAESGPKEAYNDTYEYAEYLEEKLEDVLKQMRGVGRVEVMITLETSEELVVEKDEPISRNNTTENDSAGGSRNVYQLDSGQETVYEKHDGKEMPYVTKTIYPKVSGVLVVAEGAGTGTITNHISQIAQTLFDVEAHKVQVVPMGE